jgi:putative FmdB family regulatory protein
MSTYEYKCEEGHIYVETRSIKEEQKTTECPQCGKGLSRVWNTVSTILKGNGFYSTGG